ncbi:hypothetical protein ABT063_31065 [Streptomyces sp. NPDC002838]|uniref:hypothetical protein n=1 Tax=Streptomyces sp. NPDC002838 TaxID=3154436 RepID=UPI0033307DD5
MAAAVTSPLRAFLHAESAGWIVPDQRVPEISTPISLAVIALVLTVVTVASLIKTRRDPTAKAHPGSLRAHHPKPAGSDQEASHS